MSLVDLYEKEEYNSIDDNINDINMNLNIKNVKHETNIINLDDNEIDNINKNNKKSNNKYNPKSTALKKLIDKIKKEKRKY